MTTPGGRAATVGYLPKKVLIIEDHPVFREGLVQILRRQGDLDVCAQVENAEEGIRLTRKLKPDLVLLDLSLPGKSGLEFLSELRSTDRVTKVLVVSMHDEALYADRVIRAGGDGYIMKEEDPSEIVDAIRDVLAGHIYISEEVFSKKRGLREKAQHEDTSPQRPLSHLTDQELELLQHIGAGRTKNEIATRVGKTLKQISQHHLALRKKLCLKSENELIRYAVCWVETGKAV
jgi:DNA-binding NarL/FixJ family response regulator